MALRSAGITALHRSTRVYVRASSPRVLESVSRWVSPRDCRFVATTATSMRASSSSALPSRRKQSDRPAHGGNQQQDKNRAIAHMDRLVARASSTKDFEVDMEFLRQASVALQHAQSHDQMKAALPLCALVTRARVMHGDATMECVRIYSSLGRDRAIVDLASALLQSDYFLRNNVLVSAIHACVALREPDTGFELFETSRARGTVPNRNVYRALLGLSATAGDRLSSPRVKQLLDVVQPRHGSSSSSDSTSSPMHGGMPLTSEQADEDDDEVEVEGDMDVDVDLAMNHAMLHHWMKSYSKAGHFDQVEQLFARMEDDFGLPPRANTFAILMDVAAERGDLTTTLALLEEVKHSPQHQVALVHYNVALKACGKASELAKAFHLYEEMKDRTIKPDLVTYITMMHAVYHGDLGTVDTKMVKGALVGLGAFGVACVPFVDLESHLMTTLFCGSLLGSMGLAVYMNPDGAMRALYPNADEPQQDTVIEAFFRRLREEDHCGRSIYLWREMLKNQVVVDQHVCDVLVRTCVKKRHPELAFEALFGEVSGSPSSSSLAAPASDASASASSVPLLPHTHVLVAAGHGTGFALPLGTIAAFMHSLLAQRRLPLCDIVFDTARRHGGFAQIFHEPSVVSAVSSTKGRYSYDLRSIHSLPVRSYMVRRILRQLRDDAALYGVGGKSATRGTAGLPRIEFLTLHGFELLDQLDTDDVQVRALFAMDEMEKSANNTNASRHDAGNWHYFFRLVVSPERLAEYLATPVSASEIGQQTL